MSSRTVRGKVLNLLGSLNLFWWMLFLMLPGMLLYYVFFQLFSLQICILIIQSLIQLDFVGLLWFVFCWVFLFVVFLLLVFFKSQGCLYPLSSRDRILTCFVARNSLVLIFPFGQTSLYVNQPLTDLHICSRHATSMYFNCY